MYQLQHEKIYFSYLHIVCGSLKKMKELKGDCGRYFCMFSETNQTRLAFTMILHIVQVKILKSNLLLKKKKISFGLTRMVNFIIDPKQLLRETAISKYLAMKQQNHKQMYLKILFLNILFLIYHSIIHRTNTKKWKNESLDVFIRYTFL